MSAHQAQRRVATWDARATTAGCGMLSRHVRVGVFRIAILASCLSPLFHAAPLAACPVCFGDPDSDMAQGAKWGILVLGAIVYGLLLGMVGIGASWFVRAKRLDSARRHDGK